MTIGGLDGKGAAKCSRDVSILPDVDLKDVAKDSFDAIVSSANKKSNRHMTIDTFRLLINRYCQEV